PIHNVLELSFRHNGTYDNAFFDAAVEVDFIAPDGRTLLRKGFYHSGDTWAVRFRPSYTGEWRYRYRFYSRSELLYVGEGKFQTIPSTSLGGVGANPSNPYRWMFENGQPYFPLGLQDCVNAVEGHVGGFIIDGEGRNDQSGRRMSAQEYFALYGQAGFNL